MADISDELVKLERSAEEERAKLAGLTGAAYATQRERWRRAADEVRAAITRHAQASGRDADEVERAVHEAARRSDEDPAE
ncbi:hypothetical protein [Streptomyces boluensis]|uniref:Uncharacterized protein n=1 Tax=Streptomyces boluensis TaxID=1775135 RepID=A0A964V3X9_9ACTN|nr:hypothetical protein [Streptomyces boluensis]NBE56910.1 hypothetical protein [Streptomyces boluensis]